MWWLVYVFRLFGSLQVNMLLIVLLAVQMLMLGVLSHLMRFEWKQNKHCKRWHILDIGEGIRRVRLP